MLILGMNFFRLTTGSEPNYYLVVEGDNYITEREPSGFIIVTWLVEIWAYCLGVGMAEFRVVLPVDMTALLLR